MTQAGDARKPKSIALVLGSGGARGMAHIGVIREIEAAGLHIKSISGSSMGALVGGIYAMGKLGEYEDWVTRLSQTDILKLLDWNFSGGGLVKGETLMRKLKGLLGDCEISELDIDFTAVAVDINRSTEVWISEGKLFDAIRASIAIPGIFTPHYYMGMTLVDGGLLNPVPLAPSLKTISDYTILVDANAESEHHSRVSDISVEEDHRSGMIRQLRRLVKKPGRKESKSIAAIMSKSFEIMQGALTRQYLALYRADLLIKVPHDSCMFHEFHRAGEMIALGREKARQALQHLQD